MGTRKRARFELVIRADFELGKWIPRGAFPKDSLGLMQNSILRRSRFRAQNELGFRAQNELVFWSHWTIFLVENGVGFRIPNGIVL